MSKKRWLLGIPVLVAVLGLILGGNRSGQPPSPPKPLKMTPPGGSREMYPEPGDPSYADYEEMLRQPEYDLSVKHSPGDKLPYDPEWRSMRTGKREVAVHDHAFTPDGSTSLDALAEDYIFGLNQEDEAVLKDLRITRDDFVGILWPEFPQSRPALRIPEDEAWFFSISKLTEGLQRTRVATQGRKLKLEAVQVTSVKTFTNFRILEVQITAQDDATGESIAITGDEGATVAERLGRYKFYLFRN